MIRLFSIRLFSICAFMAAGSMNAPQALAAENSDPYTVKTFCQQMTTHVPTDAEYVPGVDMDGNDVVPADLNPQSPAVFDPVIIPIEVELVQRFGLNVPNGVELKPQVGWIEIYQNGKVLFNGEEVGQQIHTICNEEKQGLSTNQDRQKSADPLVSGNDINE